MQETLNQVSEWLPLVAFFIPLVVGLVTKSALSSAGKAIVMIVLTGLATLLSTVDANAGILTVEMLTTWLGTIVISVASYLGIWAPIVRTTTAGESTQLAPNFGIGPSTPEV